MQDKQFDQKALQTLIKMASQKLGTTPERLEQQIQDGSLERAINNMAGDSGRILRQAMKDPRSAERYLNAPGAKSIYRKLGGK
ncbi:MAG: hypothetical protein K6F91_06365 [Ruminococcus sp.]|nr:hypothetical protein [Ruminococcus sp.]